MYPSSVGTETPVLRTLLRPCDMCLFMWLFIHILYKKQLTGRKGKRLREFREPFEHILEPEKGACGNALILWPSQKDMWAAWGLSPVTGIRNEGSPVGRSPTSCGVYTSSGYLVSESNSRAPSWCPESWRVGRREGKLHAFGFRCVARGSIEPRRVSEC